MSSMSKHVFHTALLNQGRSGFAGRSYNMMRGVVRGVVTVMRGVVKGVVTVMRGVVKEWSQ